MLFDQRQEARAPNCMIDRAPDGLDNKVAGVERLQRSAKASQGLQGRIKSLAHVSRNTPSFGRIAIANTLALQVALVARGLSVVNLLQPDRPRVQCIVAAHNV